MQTVRASKPIRSGRRPKTKALGRVRAESGCSTVLSRYNVRQTCHHHSPTRFPRKCEAKPPPDRCPHRFLSRTVVIEPATDEELERQYLEDDRPRPWVCVNMVASVDGATQVDGRSSSIGDRQDTVVFRSLRAIADVVLVAAATVRAEGYGSRRPSRSSGGLAARRRDARQPSYRDRLGVTRYRSRCVWYRSRDRRHH